MNENIKIEDIGLPGFTSKDNQVIDYKNYSVKYFKADLDKDEDRSFLQDIITRCMRGEFLLLSRDKMSFMDKYFMVVEYMEKD